MGYSTHYWKMVVDVGPEADAFHDDADVVVDNRPVQDLVHPLALPNLQCNVLQKNVVI